MYKESFIINCNTLLHVSTLLKVRSHLQGSRSSRGSSRGLLNPWRWGRYVVPKRRWRITIRRCVISQKSTDLIHKILLNFEALCYIFGWIMARKESTQKTFLFYKFTHVDILVKHLHTECYYMSNLRRFRRLHFVLFDNAEIGTMSVMRPTIAEVYLWCWCKKEN
jgi:hypothetical protein